MLENYKKYFLKLETICLEKKYNYELKQFLKKWLLDLIIYYNPRLDIFSQTSSEEYIENSLKNLEKVHRLTLFNIEDVLKDKDNYFYTQIEPISNQLSKSNLKNRLKKVNDQYFIDPIGNYYFGCVGACWCLGYEIQLLKEEEKLSTNFHHELTHLKQDLTGFYYPSIYPLSKEMRKMMREGDAIFHERLFKGNIFSTFINWDEINIQEHKYEFYYQIYMLLALTLPKDAHENIMLGNFKASLFVSQKEFFSEIFSLVTLLLFKSSFINEIEIESSLNSSYQDCLIKLEKYKSYKKETILKEKYKRQLEKMQEILANPELLEKEYLREYKEYKAHIFKKEPLDKQKALLAELEQKTIKDYQELLKFQINSTKESLAAYQKKLKDSEFREENKHQNYQFGLLLNKKIKIELEKNLNLSELFQTFCQKVEGFLLKNKPDEIALFFVQSLKDVSYQTKRN